MLVEQGKLRWDTTIATNCGPEPAALACNEVVTALLHHGELNDSVKPTRSRE